MANNKIEEKNQSNQPLIMPSQEQLPPIAGEPLPPEQPPKEMPTPTEPQPLAEVKEAPGKPPETPIPAAIPTEEKTETTQFWTSEKFVANKEGIGKIEKAAINLGSVSEVNLTEKAANLEEKIWPKK